MQDNRKAQLLAQVAMHSSVDERMTAFDNIKKSFAKKENNEWYTPPEWIELARAAMGSIDCDPASSHAANKTVKACAYYTKETDGLSYDWGGNVWLNPPFSANLIYRFANKVIEQIDNFNQAIVITDNCTETKWWQHLANHSNSTLFIKKRIRFLNPAGGPGPYPYRGQTLFYFGRAAYNFGVIFGDKGVIWE